MTPAHFSALSIEDSPHKKITPQASPVTICLQLFSLARQKASLKGDEEMARVQNHPRAEPEHYSDMHGEERYLSFWSYTFPRYCDAFVR